MTDAQSHKKYVPHSSTGTSHHGISSVGTSSVGNAPKGFHQNSNQNSSQSAHKQYGDTYVGEQTMRALRLKVSPYVQPRAHITTLAYIKKHAAHANAELGSLDKTVATAIKKVCDDIIGGKYWNQFTIDVFQTGSGTAWNMNMNELIANRATALQETPHRVHPNDHVNLGQSSNDVIPSALYIAVRIQLAPLLKSIERLVHAFTHLSTRYNTHIKLGRTHLQDAVPLKVGQEFDAQAEQLRYSFITINAHLKDLEPLPLGGTAVGSGINTSAKFVGLTIDGINKETGMCFRPAHNPATRMAGGEVFSHCAGLLTTLSSSLIKISTDIRVLASGPFAGLGELNLPELQQGSSIMPGKVNPVVPELVLQAALSVIGKCHTITHAVQHGPLQLLMVFPLISYELLTSIDILTHVCSVFESHCVRGMQVDTRRIARSLEQSLALITPLTRRVGYDKATELVKQALAQGCTLREVLSQEGVLNPKEIDAVLDPKTMVY